MTRIYIMTAVVGVTVSLFSAQGASDKQRGIPATITTEKGVTYNSVELINSNPEGLVVSYRPESGGLGVRTLKFQELPESLRREFNYDAGAAQEFAAAREQLKQQWAKQEPAKKQENLANDRENVAQAASEGTQPNTQSTPFPVNRFRASGTIRGAMILDTITGEAWLIDQHSVINDPDPTYFLQPKIAMQ